MARGWHILRGEGVLTLARRLPARFDVVACTVLPLADPLRLAHQVRQDVWRALQSVRGFAPVVEVRTGPDHLVLRAGGRTCQRAAPQVAQMVQDVLEDPENRNRWVRHAQPKQRRRP